MVNTKINISELMDILGLRFKNEDLLIEAITHSSYANIRKNIKYNERLEFLGDAVLQLVISEYLYKKYYSKSEGELTKLRALIVCENSLHQISKKWNLGKYLILSKGEELTGGRGRASILADCVEAIFAAIFLDMGIETVRAFILSSMKDIIDMAINNQIILDYKTKLQEHLQKKGEVAISYNLIGFEGPPHRRKFFIEVEVDGKVLGKGEGFSKKESEQMAAKMALNSMEVYDEVQA